jgi:hypothetical protein
MAKSLSPAAQAVLDAAMASAIRNLHGTYECDIAAALRAVADQKSESLCTEEHGKISVIFTDDLLAIAAELNDPPQ